MVSAMINISQKANRILAIIKARYGLRDKSQAIDRMAEEYSARILEPSFRPEFIEDVKRAEKGRFVKLKSPSELFE